MYISSCVCKFKKKKSKLSQPVLQMYFATFYVPNVKGIYYPWFWAVKTALLRT